MLSRTGHSIAVVLLIAALTHGCKASKERQLEDVAKDWCMTIRASQVMPVYPLTQDIQPGDVFLVQLPIDKQQQAWKDKGYLALDNHLARLKGLDYSDFYVHSFPLAKDGDLPRDHISSKPSWDGAPHAAFPTYSFSVKKGGGLNLALPISGVPIGLGLLGADAAEGSVSIGQAHTLGIDMISVDTQLRAWSQEAKSRAFLVGLASTGERKNYVRVVTRIYLTGELDVSLRDSSQFGAGLDAGVPSPVALLVPKLADKPTDTPQTALDNYKTGIDELNGMLKDQDRTETDAAGNTSFKAGGSLRLTSATARTISLKETFDPPLVLGYLGFDCEIGVGGELGPAVPTFALVSGALGGEAFLGRAPLARPYMDQFWVSSYEIAKSAAATDETAKHVVAECDALGRFVPPSLDAWKRGPNGPLVHERTVIAGDVSRDYELYREWRASLASSTQALSSSLAHFPFTYKRADKTTVEVVKDSPTAKELTTELEALRAHPIAELVEERHAQARHALADWMFANLYSKQPK